MYQAWLYIKARKSGGRLEKSSFQPAAKKCFQKLTKEYESIGKVVGMRLLDVQHSSSFM